MSIDQIASAALKLSPREKAVLAETLWESLGDPYDGSSEDEAATRELVERRDAEIETGKVKAISHEELMRRLRE